MRILLIEPAKSSVTLGGEDVHLFEPLALEYIAAGVPNHDVRLHDMRIHPEIGPLLEEFRPQIVGITSYTVHVNGVRTLLEEIKTRYPEILSVVGGHHATVAPHDFSRPSIDLVVQGEGVFAFREIVRRFEHGESFTGIPGVMVQLDGRLTGDTEPLPIDLDALPFPNRSLVPEDRKHYYAEWMQPLASIRTSKGCPFRCNFCALWKLTNGSYLRRDPERIVEELKGIQEEFVFFADDESLVDADRMMRLAGLIEKARIRKKYFLYGRSDTIRKNRELLAAWKRIGLERVFVGLEFFRDTDLVLIRKGSKTDDNEKAMNILKDLDLEAYASFIVLPEFTKEDFKAFREYTRSLPIRYATFAVLTPLPGTDLYEEVREKIITDNYDLFDFLHTVLPTRLSLKEFYQAYTALMWNAIPRAESLRFIRHFPLRRIPEVISKGMRIRKRMQDAYKDYEETAGIMTT